MSGSNAGPTMTPEEIAAWESMARDGTLSRYASGWIVDEHGRRNSWVCSDPVWEAALAARMWKLADHRCLFGEDGRGERIFAALGTSREFIPRRDTP